MPNPLMQSGATLRSTFSIGGEWPSFTATFESGDGRGRNSDYRQGVEVILARLGERGAVLQGARITSKDILQRVAVEDFDASFEPTGLNFPIHLADVEHQQLRLALGHAGALVGSKPNSSGNSTRRMNLQILLPLPIISAEDLEIELSTWSSRQVLMPIADPNAIDEAMAKWLEHLEREAQALTSKIQWVTSASIAFKKTKSGKRLRAWDVQLSIHSAGSPWAVEINAPTSGIDANNPTTIAEDRHGRLYLIRQGRLRANGDSLGAILEDEFRRASGLAPTPVGGGNTPKARIWYVVADLGASPADIIAQTGDFVHACARVRMSNRGIILPRESVISLANGETGGFFQKRAIPAQPERAVQRIQGEVWLSLQQQLARHGVEIVKLRRSEGYEVDGLIMSNSRSHLIEIKTALSAAHIYEGLGQLILYNEMFGLHECSKILLIPGEAPYLMKESARKVGVQIHKYDVNDGTSIVFPHEFIDSVR